MKRRRFLLGIAAAAVPAKAMAACTAITIPYNAAGAENLSLGIIVEMQRRLDEQGVPEPAFIVVPEWWAEMITQPSNKRKVVRHGN